MPFKSKAQRRKFAEVLVKGEISPETFEEWNRETGNQRRRCAGCSRSWSTCACRTSCGSRPSLIVLRRCIYAPYGESDDSPKARRMGTVVVNLSSAVGVAERDWPE